MDSLRQNLESQGLKDVIYMVINHQGAQAQRLHPMLVHRVSVNITLFKQDEQQEDVWKALGGEKDDFFIYDRCGRLTNRISLPYSIIGHGHIENAIKDTYCKRLCGECTYENAEVMEECRDKTDAQPVEGGGTAGGHDHAHPHHHGHHHHHHHHHHHPSPSVDDQHQAHGASQGQHQAELEQMQQDSPNQEMSRDTP